MQIAILIPTTSNNRNEWKYIVHTYLYSLCIKTFLETYNKEYEYKFFIGIDKRDRIFDNIKNKLFLQRHLQKYNINIEFIYTNNCTKGHLTVMWNLLFKKAYDEGYDYFFQCGDDVTFKSSGWTKDCILSLQNNNNIGLAGPINNNTRILTQGFVSRKHMEIFGYFFPPEIINWGCDDWYNFVYTPNNLFPLKNHFCSNDGGVPRYEINNDINFRRNFEKNTSELRKNVFELAEKHKLKVIEYVKSNS